jgi:hypothetical protein
MVVHTYNPSTREVEAGGSRVPDQPGLPRDFVSKNQVLARHWWLTPVIPATQEAEIRRIAVQSQPGQIVHETLS